MNDLLQRMAALSPEKQTLLRQRLDPLSYAQERLWFLDQLQPGSPTYNIPLPLRLAGPLRVPLLVQSLDAIVRRHAVLRTTFPTIDGRPVPWLVDRPVLVAHVDLTWMPDADRQRRLPRVLDAEMQRGFDLANGPVLRAMLVRLGEQDHVLALTVHHLVFDGWSRSILIQELAGQYDALTRGRPSPLVPLKMQYSDHARAQRRWIARGGVVAELAYWRETLGGPLPVFELPADRPRPSTPSLAGAEERIAWPATLIAALKAVGEQEGATLFMTLLAGFASLLARYTSEADVIIGTPISGRPTQETEQLVGCFVNSLALRIDASGRQTFRQLVARAREVALGAFAHQHLPFSMLVEELRPDRRLSQTPVFQVMLVLQNTPAARPGAGGARALAVTELGLPDRTAKFDLMLLLTETPDGLAGSLRYRADLLEPAAVRRMASHLHRLLHGAAANPDALVASLPLLSAEEETQVLRTWQGPAVTWPAPATVVEQIEAQAARSPEAIAVVAAATGATLTYAALDRESNRVAWALHAAGVGPEARVGVWCERGLELLVALVGVLKAGAIYVPLDPTYPEARLALMVTDARLQRVLTSDAMPPVPGGADVPRLTVTIGADRSTDAAADGVANGAADGSAGAPARGPRRGRHAAAQGVSLLYTSGSTGRPKGVVTTQAGLANRLRWMQAAYELTSADRVLQKTPVSFDVAGWELFWPLTAGAQLVLLPPGVAGSTLVASTLRTSGVTVCHFVPSMLRLLAAEAATEAHGAPLRLVVCSGEALTGADVASAEALWPGVAVENLYGPTEASIDVTRAAGEAGPGSVPLGRPISNTQVYVCDDAGQPTAVGVPGELYLGGIGLAREYWGQPAATAARFVPDPWGTGTRLYRTGDRGWWRADGLLMYGGRRDGQVKLRGVRIELGEVEAVVGAHAAVAACVARVWRDQLVAYVVLREPGDLPESALRAWARARLTEAMTPNRFVALATLPRLPNGKVARDQLPAPDELAPAVYVEPRTPVEAVLAQIWAAVLRVPRVGATDQFFALGGHSLAATQVTARVADALQVTLPLREIFDRPRLDELAARIEQLRANGGESPARPPIARADRTRDLPLSSAQQRLWFLALLNPGSAAYNIPMPQRLRGTLDVAALRGALAAIVRRHEILRTRFVADAGIPRQVIEPVVRFALPLVDSSAEPESRREAQARRVSSREARLPFTLSEAPLVRAALLRLADDDHVLLVTMHHIVSDGWSIGVLMNELMELYAALRERRPARLAPLPLQYADFALWHRGWLDTGQLEAQLAFWRRHLDGAPPAIHLPADQPATGRGSPRAAVSVHLLSAEHSDRIRLLCLRLQLTPFVAILAMFQALLARYSGQDTVVVGTPVSGRGTIELEPLIGLFVNTLPLRASVADDPPVRTFLARVRETLLQAHAHQDLPFDRLVDELGVERDLGRTPVFQVMFAMQTAWAPPQDAPSAGLAATAFSSGAGAARFEWNLHAADRPSGFALSLQYDADRFAPDTIARALQHLDALLDHAARDPECRLSSLSMLTEAEQRQLTSWNAMTRAPLPIAPLPRQVEAVARRTPEAPAVRDEERWLDYRELNARANRVAHRLRSLGAGREQRVALLTARSVDLIVGLLAILKAGAVYVAVDPALPDARLQAVLTAADVRVVVTHTALRDRLPPERPHIDLDSALLADESDEDLREDIWPEQAAYLLYTSGSTGQPKGVVVEHRQIQNYVSGLCERLALPAGFGYATVSTIAADLGNTGIFASLATGGCLHVISADCARDPAAFAQYARQYPIDCLKIVPSHLAALLDVPSPAAVLPRRCLILGGETLTGAFAARLRALAPDLAIWNHYGPTEATIGMLTSRVGGDLPGDGRIVVPLGMVLPNTQAHVLDRRGQPLPVGVVGELYIGGDGVARGYHGAPAATAERFLPDPWGAPGMRLYRTGDRVRRRVDGAIEFVGRVDHQVKVRGYRVEPAEVEAAIRAATPVSAVVVTASRDGSGEPRLIAYVVPPPGGAIVVEDLRRALSRTLPDYMQPAAIVPLDAMPLTAQGKIDRRALPLPDAPSSASASPMSRTEPAGPVEAVMCAVWADLLGRDSVGPDENFFQLGGHSLRAMQLLSRVRDTLDVTVPVRWLFEAQTPAALTTRLLADATTAASAVDAAELYLRVATLSDAALDDMLAAREAVESPGAAHE